MFTGRIEKTATIAEVRAESLLITVDPALPLIAGGAVCLDGVRLTMESAVPGELVATVTDETRRRTTLDRVTAGTPVHFELPLAAGDRIDGHLVQGHVDGVGKVLRIDDEPTGRRVWIKPGDRLLARLVAKSSVALNGVSLTVAEVLKDRFSVVLVPTTLAKTNLGTLQAGDRVNLESDLLTRMAREGHGPELLEAVARLPWAGHLSGPVGVQKVVAQLAAGGGVVVWDPTLEGEGDVVFAGEKFRPEAMTFLLTQVCGHTTIPCAAEVLQRLEIPPMPGEGIGRVRRCTCRWIWRHCPAPVSVRPIGLRRSVGWPIQRPAPKTSSSRATSSRWRLDLACWPSGAVTRRQRSRCAWRPGSRRSECVAR
jgi:3,4-dihydroxy 2-butanone 4-phosphate synthase/3,4-dihydroxy 2-butanone 4-phosphate synthase/GTP cyclohydrolase II